MSDPTVVPATAGVVALGAPVVGADGVPRAPAPTLPPAVPVPAEGDVTVERFLT